MKTEPAIVKCKRTPILMVAAEDDNYAAVSSRKLAAIASGNVRLHMLDSGGHGVYMLEAHPELVGIMLDFAGQNLK